MNNLFSYFTYIRFFKTTITFEEFIIVPKSSRLSGRLNFFVLVRGRFRYILECEMNYTTHLSTRNNLNYLESFALNI